MKSLLLLLVCAAPALAQVNGSVTGVITDSTSAVVTGAQVALTFIDTGVIIRTVTNEAGVYRFPSAPIGRYELRVSAPGFKTFVQQPIVVETNQSVRVDAALELGATQESVTVTAEAITLDRESSAVGTQISHAIVTSLPYQLTNSLRNPFAFVKLTPGAVGTSGAGDGTQIAGSRTYGNEAYIDGVPVSYNPWQNVAGPTAPALDTVAEFRVQTALAPAEFGRTGGGAVLMATRSGTNQLHGSLYSLFRNNVLDARRYNAAIADINRQGEFGGSLGGPVFIPKLYSGRNRTFFFTNYTGFRRAGAAQGSSVTVPTQLMRAGNFSEGVEQIFDAQTANANGVRQPFPSNTIPRARFSPLAMKFQDHYPQPNAPGVANNYRGVSPNSLSQNTSFAKLDHAFTERNHISGSYRWRHEVTDRANGILEPLSDHVFQGITTHNVVLGVDNILRPNLLNRLQAGYTRFFSPILESGDAGIFVPGSFESGFPGIRFSGQGIQAMGYGNDRSPTNNLFNVLESVAWTKGTHNTKFGIRFDHYQMNQAVLGFREGQYTFSQFSTSQPQMARTGNSYASFLLGQVNNGTMAFSQPVSDRTKIFGLFAQDDWKVTRRLTVNYGYRWEFQTPFTEQRRRLSRMDPNVPNPGADGRLGAIVFAGDGPGRSGLSNFIYTYYGAHAPRLGLAYQLARNTVIRAGAGLFYAPLAFLDNSKAGFNASINISSTDGGLTPVFLLDQGWPAGVVKYPPFIDPTLSNGQATFTTEFRHGGSGRLSRASQLQFSLQQMLPAQTVLELDYVGTLSHGLTNNALVAVNQLDPGYLALGSLLTRNITDPLVAAQGFRPPYPTFRGTLAQSLRAFPQYQGITTADAPTGNSTYHALYLKAEKRFARGLTFLIAYAFAKSISDVTFTNTDLATPQDQYNRRAEKSIADVDVPQRLTVSFSYELPFGRGKSLLPKGPLAQIAGGWSISGILNYEAGGTLRISTPNNLPIFNGYLRPDRVAGVPIAIGAGHGDFQPLNSLSGQRGDLYLNRDAFAIPAPFTLGNLGVYLPDIRGFGNRQEDLSIQRRFVFRESRRIELRGDFFNAFNRKNLNNPVTDLSNANFGRITGQGAARIIQLGFRAEF
jgi:Carboxypeptidase regulatory-like domain/TonB dependent receptor